MIAPDHATKQFETILRERLAALIRRARGFVAKSCRDRDNVRRALAQKCRSETEPGRAR